MVWEPVFALVLALLFVLLLVGALGWRHPSGRGVGVSMLFLLLLLFPLLWVAALWTGPIGPTFLGLSIIPIILIGLLFALMAAVLVEPVPPPATRETEGEVAVGVFGTLFWILVLVAIGMIIAGYLY